MRIFRSLPRLRGLILLSIVGSVSVNSASSLPAAGRNPEISTGSLVREMVDLDRLSAFPDPGYRVFQFSSYDRRSKQFGGENWFANSDGFGREPIPGVQEVLRAPEGDRPGLFLLADVEGPGAIVRTWTARMNGEITMRLDGNEAPLFRGPANDFLQRLYPALNVPGGAEDAVYRGAMTQRDAGYYPVPFAERCRIEWEGSLEELHFYHIEFRRYEPGTRVRTFSASDLAEWRKDIEEACGFLRSPATMDSMAAGSSDDVRSVSANLAPGESINLASLEGRPGKICRLKTRVRAGDLDRALRQAVLTISFDRASRPQVEAPLGDFYGAAPGINPFDAIPFTVDPGGWMTCRLVMPFADSMHAAVENRGDAAIELESEIRIRDYRWSENESLHFNGKWRVDHEMDVGGGLIFDLPYLMVNGRGRFVGCAAIILNPAEGPHPSGSWWGEGDEKIYVDEDLFPSFFGTGSEDYFNYSWSSPDLFSHAYFGQPRNDGPGNGGFVSNNRWHILDDIPFRNRLSFYMEMFTHTRVTGLAYARMTWFYTAPGAWDDSMPIFREDLRPQKRPAWKPAAVGGTKDALFTQMEDMAGGHKDLILERPEWGAGKIISWEPSGDGDRLALDPFTVPAAGEYDLVLVMILSPKAGKFAVALDGELLLDNEGQEWVVDLYTPFQTMARRNSPGHTLRLDQGGHRLTLVSRGRSPESGGTAIQGDFIWIRERK